MAKAVQASGAGLGEGVRGLKLGKQEIWVMNTAYCLYALRAWGARSCGHPRCHPHAN